MAKFTELFYYDIVDVETGEVYETVKEYGFFDRKKFMRKIKEKYIVFDVHDERDWNGKRYAQTILVNKINPNYRPEKLLSEQ